jgi:alpha-mannosidase
MHIQNEIQGSSLTALWIQYDPLRKRNTVDNPLSKFEYLTEGSRGSLFRVPFDGDYVYLAF